MYIPLWNYHWGSFSHCILGYLLHLSSSSYYLSSSSRICCPIISYLSGIRGYLRIFSHCWTKTDRANSNDHWFWLDHWDKMAQHIGFPILFYRLGILACRYICHLPTLGRANNNDLLLPPNRSCNHYWMLFYPNCSFSGLDSNQFGLEFLLGNLLGSCHLGSRRRMRGPRKNHKQL